MLVEIQAAFSVFSAQKCDGGFRLCLEKLKSPHFWFSGLCDEDTIRHVLYICYKRYTRTNMTDSGKPVVLVYTCRENSYGTDTKMKSFTNFEEAREYLLAEFYEYIEDNRFPEASDPEDIFEHPFLDRHGKLAAAAALPTMKMATELFSIENLRHVAKVGVANVLYAPWSESLMIVPYEIRIGLL